MRKLQTKLLVNFLPLIIIPITITVLLSGLIVPYMLRNSFKERLNENLRGAELAIELEQEKLINSARAVASSTALIEAIKADDRQALLETLEHPATALGIDRVRVMNREGVVMVSARNPAQYGYLGSPKGIPDALRGVMTAGLEKTDMGICVEVFMPVLNGSTVTGVLEFANIIDYELLSGIKEKYGLDLMVIDGDHLQATTLKDAAVIRDALDKLLSAAARPGEKRYSEDILLGRNHYFVVSQPIISVSARQVAGYLLLTLSSESIHAINRLLIMVQVMLVAVLLPVTVFISRLVARKVVQPLGALVAMAQEISRGNLSHRAAVVSDDEVGMLAVTCNKMAADLQQMMVARDHEEAKSLEKDRLMVRQAHLADLGKLAAGLTHEINTRLTYIKGNIELLKNEISVMNAGAHDGIRPLFESIDDGVNGISAIVESMRQLSGCSRNERVPSNVFSTVIDAIRIVYNRSRNISPLYVNGRPFHIDRDKNEEVFMAPIDAQSISQVWIVMLNNSFDEFLKSDIPFEERYIRIEILKADGKISITIRDNAGGIADTVINRIFDMFVSTKQEAGTGLGLHIAKKIIEDHEGTIRAYNDGAGAVFEVTI